MRWLKSLASFIRDAVAIMFGGLDGKLDLESEEWDRRYGPPGPRVPPREEHVGETSPGWTIERCGHEPDFGNVGVTICGRTYVVHIPDGAPICAACFGRWLESQSTTCCACGEPILTGMLVAENSPFDEPPFVHGKRQCCVDARNYAGMWGPGRLVSLHELHPDYIAAGTRTIKEFAEKRSGGQTCHAAFTDKPDSDMH